MTSPRRVTLAPPQEADVEVEIDGRVFAARSMTRTAQAKLDEAEKGLETAATSDEAARTIIAILDALVEPTAGQRKPVSEVLLPMWEGDKLSLSQLSQLMEDISEAAQSRPT